MQIETIIQSLRKQRSIFHSEADFQHALAWELHLDNPSAHVRLEVGHKGCAGPTERIDIVVTSTVRRGVRTEIQEEEIRWRGRWRGVSPDPTEFYGHRAVRLRKGHLPI